MALPLCTFLSPHFSSLHSSAGSLAGRYSFPLTAAAERRVGPRRRRSCSGGRDEPTFMDEDGAVEDLDGYLKYLSPKYELVWDTKPSCWLILYSILAMTVVSFLIGSWWYIFLYAYPKGRHNFRVMQANKCLIEDAIQECSSMIAEHRKKIRSGIEDTFGWCNAESVD